MNLRQKKHDGVHGMIDLMTSLFAIFVLFFVIMAGATTSHGGHPYTGTGSKTDTNSGTNTHTTSNGNNECEIARQKNPQIVCLGGTTSIPLGEDKLKFATDSADISESGVSAIRDTVLQQIVHHCKTDKKLESIVIEGHTDRSGENKKSHGPKGNLDLSARRALAVSHVLIDLLDGHDDKSKTCLLQKIHTVGRGSSAPKIITDSLNVEKNRRVEVHIRTTN